MWLSAQLGSREHYSVPSALHSAGLLGFLLTDVWLSRRLAALASGIHPALAHRRCDDVPDVKVRSRTLSRLLFDAKMRLKLVGPWETILLRNSWFGGWVADEVAALPGNVFFSYSYTALQPFQSFNGRRILGQIDPGPREHDIVAEAAKGYESLAQPESRPPSSYWQLWRGEVELADRIIVNSAWSASLLEEAGVPVGKMVEVPLVYEPGWDSSHSSSGDHLVTRIWSPVTSAPSRLRALFLGSVILRKGVGQLLDAIRIIRNEPVDFTFAGPVGVNIPDDVRAMPNVRFLGAVDRATAEQLYGESDVFLFPTLSDGFGLTQLEALGHGLPVIASTNCGQVVEHGVSGLVLGMVTPEAIAEAIMSLMRDQDLLARLKAGARVPDKFHPRHLAPALLALAS